MSIKASAITVMMALTKDSRNDLIESIMLDHGARALPLIEINDVVQSRKTNRSRLVATLLHIKKSTKKTISYKEIRTSKPKEASYYRFMILADDQLNVFGIMIKNDSNGKNIFAHHTQFSVGSKVVISRPKHEGHYKGLALIETDCICPIFGMEPMLKTFHQEVQFKKMNIAAIGCLLTILKLRV